VNPAGVADFQELQNAQFRLQMIENYRQTTALQVMSALAVFAAKEDPADRPSAAELAKQAKQYADALVAEIFQE
jgi:uncharacterized protein YqiB (DUF1249 family)